ncbi:hypothetical protein NERG_00481 [Nematocida ausubeli]|uniref:Uncharacterized protein n=1 Tax=Nematocida ausubeli (strain ATCC PRA-371 / ERTm2) TaxID=1913371 RepID=H8ZA60_NEMA1|nr:hypothetical protein NERG_00481 [Nematocida ausubeli]
MHKKFLQMTDHIAIYKIIVLCMVCSCIRSSMFAASNEYNSSNEVMDEEWMRNIDIKDLYSAIPTEHYNSAVQLEHTGDMYDLGNLDDLYLLEGIPESDNTSNSYYPRDLFNLDTINQAGNLGLLEGIPESENIDGRYYMLCPPNPNNGNQKDNIVYIFYRDIDGHTFYINSAECKIYIYPTGDMAYIEDIFYMVYRDSLNNLVYINSSVGPSTFNIENTSKDESSNQGEILFNSLTREAPLKRLAESTSSGSDNNPSAKKYKHTEVVEEGHKSAKLEAFDITANYIDSFESFQHYRYMVHKDTTRDKPHGFSYWFPNRSINNESISCKCGIGIDYKNEMMFWHFLTSSHHNSLAEKIDCIISLSNARRDAEHISSSQIFYHYYFFLKDLKKYIESHINIKHIRAKYNYTDSSKNNICSRSKIEPETLGEIYEETQTDLKWWVNSMSVITEKTEEIKSAGSADAPLKEKLHLILKLPEILRDLVLITPEILSKTMEEMKRTSDSEASRFFCIIEYLYYLVNGDSDGMNTAYKKVQKLSVNRKPINGQSTMMVYGLVYNLFCFFYQCAPFTCVTDVKSKEGKSLHRETHIKNIFQTHCPYIPKNGVFRLHGKRAIVEARINKYTENKEIFMLDQSIDQAIETVKVVDSFSLEGLENVKSLKIVHSDHYHVQLVDNTRHTVKLIPIPYPYCENYNSSDESIQRKTHSIRYIVEYIKSVLKSTYPEKNSKFNVYPFKYNRNDKTWSIVDKNCYQSNKDTALYNVIFGDYDIVFYYFEEDICAKKFSLLEIGSDILKRHKKPRIPIFLTNFMLKNTLVGPYKLFKLYSSIKPEYSNCYKDIKPTKIFCLNENQYRPSSKKTKLPSETRYIKYYYSDFFIQSIYQKKVCTAECFIMCASDKSSLNISQPYVSWYTQVKRSVREYTNYCFSISSAKNIQNDSVLQCEKNVASKFLNRLQRKSSSGDKVTYGVCIYHRSLDSKEVAVPIMCEKMRSLLKEKFNPKIKFKYSFTFFKTLLPRVDIKDIKKNTPVFITVKTFNYAQANLGMHYDIIAALFHNNNSASTKKPAPKTATRKSPRATRARISYTK